MKLQPVSRGGTIVVSVSIMLTMEREISFPQWKFQWRSTEFKKRDWSLCLKTLYLIMSVVVS